MISPAGLSRSSDNTFMKILFLLTQDLKSPSGLGRYYPLGRELANLGHEVTIVALHPDYRHLENRQFDNGKLHVRYVSQMHVRKSGNAKSYFPAWQLLLLSARATVRLSSAALTTTADIVHVGKPHPMNSLAGLLAKRLRGRQLYLDCDDAETAGGHFTSGWQKRGVHFFESRMPLWADFVTTHTCFNRDRMLSGGVPPEKVFYLSNGVDVNRFLPPAPQAVLELKDRLGFAGKKIVLFMGSLSRPSHPVDLLLEAFRQVRQAEPLARLLVVGGGDDYDRLLARVQEMGLGQGVRFVGFVPPEQTVLYYSLADVSVDPVNDDDIARGRSPLKLFESWACGVPFVTADVGDRKILLREPAAGILARPGDSVSLGRGILDVLEHPELAGRFRELGRQYVQDYFWTNLARKMESIYKENLPKLSDL